MKHPQEFLTLGMSNVLELFGSGMQQRPEAISNRSAKAKNGCLFYEVLLAGWILSVFCTAFGAALILPNWPRLVHAK